MSRHGAGSAGIGQAPEKSGKPATALSEQQRIWVREIAETIRERRQKSGLPLQSKQGAASGDHSEPGIGHEIQ